MGQSVALFRLQAASVYPRQELLVQGNPRYHKGFQVPFAPSDTTGCFALRAPAILKHLKSSHFSTKNGSCSMLCRSYHYYKVQEEDIQAAF